jgi:SAM-dependent methyltransferase
MSGHGGHGHGHDRHGARQPERFDPARAAALDDPARFEHLPPAEVLRLLDAPQGARVIDFGTGTGTYAIEIASRRPDLEVIGLDEQPEMLAMLRAQPAAAELGNLRPVLTDAIDELRESADRILAINVFHELGDEAMRGLAGLLKPGGSALFIDWRSDVDRPVGPPKDHVYDAAEARRRIESFGLSVERQALLGYHFALVARKAS